MFVLYFNHVDLEFLLNGRRASSHLMVFNQNRESYMVHKKTGVGGIERYQNGKLFFSFDIPLMFEL